VLALARGWRPESIGRGSAEHIECRDSVEQCNVAGVRDSKLGPPMVARRWRSYTLYYDAWAAYDEHAMGQNWQQTAAPGAERTIANKNEAISFAAYRRCWILCRGQNIGLRSLIAALGYDPNDVSMDLTKRTGLAMWRARQYQLPALDGSNQLNGYADYTGYTPVNPRAQCQ